MKQTSAERIGRSQLIPSVDGLEMPIPVERIGRRATDPAGAFRTWRVALQPEPWMEPTSEASASRAERWAVRSKVILQDPSPVLSWRHVGDDVIVLGDWACELGACAVVVMMRCFEFSTLVALACNRLPHRGYACSSSYGRLRPVFADSSTRSFQRHRLDDKANDLETRCRPTKG
jgi:hypothetical protein